MYVGLCAFLAGGGGRGGRSADGTLGNAKDNSDSSVIPQANWQLLLTSSTQVILGFIKTHEQKAV